MTLLKKCLPDILAVLLFAVLAFAYFFPADIEGRILYRHDASAGRGAGQEGIEYLQKTAYEIPLCDWSSDVCSSDPHV